LIRSIIEQHVAWMLCSAVYASIAKSSLDASNNAANQPMQKSTSDSVHTLYTTTTTVSSTTERGERGDSGHDVLWDSKTIALVIVTVTVMLLCVGATGIVIYCIRLRRNMDKSQGPTNTQTPSESPLLSQSQSSSDASSRTTSLSTSSSSESSKEIKVTENNKEEHLLPND
jgi:hypothetical protein